MLLILDTHSPSIIKLRNKNIQKKSTLPASTMQLIESNDNDISLSMNNTDDFLQQTVESVYETLPNLEDNTEGFNKNFNLFFFNLTI